MTASILTVDDSASIRLTTRVALSNAGYTVTEAVDGKDGLAKLDAGQFDIIVTDLNMPNMDGIDATREISRLLSPEGPKIIAVTASVSNMQKQECDDVGFSGFIPKPVRIDKLVEVLTEHLH